MSEQPTFDIDTDETSEWRDALAAVLEADGTERAHFLLEQLIDEARRSGVNLPYSATTAGLHEQFGTYRNFDTP